jgi:hypothetical protein
MLFSRINRFNLASISSSAAPASSHIALLALWIVCFGIVQPALAEVRVSGRAGTLKIEARHATVDEILRVLQTSYKFRFVSSGVLSNQVNGTYTGSLPRVVSRLLEGHDYVMRSSAAGVQVSIISAGQPIAQQRQTSNEPVKECKYDDGVRVIPVEC